MSKPERRAASWLVCLLIAPSVSAQTSAPSSAPASAPIEDSQVANTEPADGAGLWERDRLTGDWGGLRTQLEEAGLSFSLTHIGTLAINTRGGTNTDEAIEYRSTEYLSITIDLEKTTGWWKGGELYILGDFAHGPGITERHVGDLMGVNEYEGRDYAHGGEFWIKQRFLDDKLWFKLGKIDAAVDFGATTYALDFLNFGLYIPMLPTPTTPDQAMGATVGFEPCEWFYLLAGVFDAQGTGGTWGWRTAFHDEAQTITLYEAGLRPTLELDGREYPGRYAVGGWHNSAPKDVFFNDLGGRLAPRTYRGDAGVYFVGEQLVYKESDDALDEQGIGLFAQYAHASPNQNEITNYFGAGIAWTGLIPTRDADVLGIAFLHADLSGQIKEFEDRHSETAIEWFYKLRVTPWFVIQPDLQYVVNPGGDGRDALVLQLQTQISF